MRKKWKSRLRQGTAVLLAAAMAAGLLFNRFAKLISLPNVTGYLVSGLLIGPSVLNLIP